MSASMSIYDPIAYVSAIIALNAIVIPAVPVLQYLVARHVKAEGDPARGGFKWLHGALLTLLATCVLQVAYHSFLFASAGASNPEVFRENANQLNRIGSTATLFSILAEVTLVLCVSQLVSSAATTAPRRLLGYLVAAALGLAVACAIAVFGYGMWSSSASTRDYWSRFRFSQSFSIVYLVGAILVMLAAVGVFVRAMQARKAAGAGAVVVRKLTVIAGLVMFIMVWRFVRKMVSLSGTLPGTRGLDITGLQFADIVLGMWGSFGVMVMIYLVGKKREGGLWSENRAKLERHSEEQAAA